MFKAPAYCRKTKSFPKTFIFLTSLKTLLALEPYLRNKHSRLLRKITFIFLLHIYCTINAKGSVSSKAEVLDTTNQYLKKMYVFKTIEERILKYHEK